MICLNVYNVIIHAPQIAFSSADKASRRGYQRFSGPSLCFTPSHIPTMHHITPEITIAARRLTDDEEMFLEKADKLWIANKTDSLAYI